LSYLASSLLDCCVLMTHSIDQTAAAARSSGLRLVERREAQRSLGGLRTPPMS
jgi:hypothetical protein